MQIIQHQRGSAIVSQNRQTASITLEILDHIGATLHWLILSPEQAQLLADSLTANAMAMIHQANTPNREPTNITRKDVGNADALLAPYTSSTEAGTESRKGTQQ